ncbi:MAG: PIN domain-containing protein [Firmicutes bacterium]|nr:PIN domain-containing protein [Bacillota bacterium]
MRVMLDTNVLISGMVFQGLERRLLESILKNDHVLVLCEQTETEAEMVLLRKFSISERFLKNFLQLFRIERLPVLPEVFQNVSRLQRRPRAGPGAGLC